MGFIEVFQEYRAAAYPLLAAQTHEERRLIADFKAAKDQKTIEERIFHWSAVAGLAEIATDAHPLQIQNPSKVLEMTMTLTAGTIVILKDFPLSSGLIVRQVRDMLGHLETTGKTLLFVAPVIQCPVELEKDLTFVEYKLPTKAQLEVVFDHLIQEQEKENKVTLDVSARKRIIDNATGMTENEARNSLSLALAKHGAMNDGAAKTILTEKAGVLKKTDLLSWYESSTPIEKLGGFGNVKLWLEMIAPIFWNPDEAVAFGLLPQDFPRSVLFTGPAGTGKSMAAQMISHYLKIGCVRTDFGKIFSAGEGRVGAAEGAINRRNALVEAMEPVEDWWDEAEKGLTTGESKQNPWEGRVAGSLLTWFEMHRARVLTVATVNKQELLAPEMLSRFQKVFFVGLPTTSERAEIIRSHVDDRPVIKLTNADLFDLAGMTDKYSGRELRNGVQQATARAFAAGAKSVTIDHLMAAFKSIKPVARIRQGYNEQLEKWALDNGVEWASNAPDNTSAPATQQQGGRKIKGVTR